MTRFAWSGVAAAAAGAALGIGYALASPAGDVTPPPTSRMGPFAGSPLGICRGRVPGNVGARLAELQRYADEHRVQPVDNPLGSDDPGVDLMEKLGLLEGHLMIGKMLVDANKVSDGLPHFGHPVRELYDYIKPAIEKRKLRSYDAQLKALEAEVRASGPGGKTGALYSAAIAWVGEVRQSIPAARRSDGKFILETIALLLEDAAEDFGESLENGRIVNTVEYHDAMGFTIYAKALLTAYRPQADAFAKGRIDRVMAEIDGAMAAFPALVPPPRPAKSVSQMKGHAARVKDLTK